MVRGNSNKNKAMIQLLFLFYRLNSPPLPLSLSKRGDRENFLPPFSFEREGAGAAQTISVPTLDVLGGLLVLPKT
jgi:hypothetical protein